MRGVTCDATKFEFLWRYSVGGLLSVMTSQNPRQPAKPTAPGKQQVPVKKIYDDRHRVAERVPIPPPKPPKK